MMEPIVRDILQLQSGVEIRVRTSDPPQYEEVLVHGDLCYHIADLIARIKLGGGAGVASELNFCLYCRTRLSSLSVPAGFTRAEFPFQDPAEELGNVFFWKSLDNDEDRQLFFEESGNRYTILHEIPGWYTASRSPPDSMHLLYLGGVNWILKQIVLGPSLLAPRRVDHPEPINVYNTALEFDLWLPYSAGRSPPKIGQTNTRIKADQLKLMSKVMFILFYLAMRDGDDIAHDNHFTAIGRPDLAPALADCFPSRNLPRHYKQILRFCVAICTLDTHSIRPAKIAFAQSLLETLCIEYTRMNVPLPPNFHYMQHLEESILRTGSLYNTHVWPMERANGIVAKINHNGRGKGMLEGTMMRGWWEFSSLQNLVRIILYAT
ncbi:hypothetical protein BDV93DRAFT_584343 [Ceratobasidium sp. AG-I]|nr:hypothetical protein BDV93DRAFT_584343 [Ceratobasidium sp. AG-I]